MTFQTLFVVAVSSVLLCGCRQSAEVKRLQAELTEITSKAANAQAERDAVTSELVKVRAERDALKTQLATRQRFEQSVAPTMTLAQPLVSSDRLGMVQVTVFSLMNGEEGVRAERLYAMKVDAGKKQGKRVYYYDVMVKNVQFSDELDVFHSQFKLEDDKNNTYQCELSRDYLTGRIHPGKTVRGGIYFSVYEDAKPRRLIYKTGIESRGISLEVVTALP